MSEEKRVRWYSSLSKLLASCFCGNGDGKNVDGSKMAGPEGTMVAAAKHFSGAHKLRLDSG